MKKQILASAKMTFIYSIDRKNIHTPTIFHNNGLYEFTDTSISQDDFHIKIYIPPQYLTTMVFMNSQILVSSKVTIIWETNGLILAFQPVIIVET